MHRFYQDETVRATGLDGYSSKGDWTPLSLGSATATILKYDDRTVMNLTAESIDMKATVKDTSGFLSKVEVSAYSFTSDGSYYMCRCAGANAVP